MAGSPVACFWVCLPQGPGAPALTVGTGIEPWGDSRERKGDVEIGTREMKRIYSREEGLADRFLGTENYHGLRVPLNSFVYPSASGCGLI